MTYRRSNAGVRATAFTLSISAALSTAHAEVPYDGWRGQRAGASYAGAPYDRRPLDNSPRYGSAYNPPPPAYARERWSGFYAGAHLGGSWGSSTPKGLSSDSVSSDGFLGGLQGGFNWQYQQLVLGAEADVSLAGIDGMRFYPGSAAAVGVDMSWLGSIRGRMGFAWESLLLYGTAGIAFTGLGLETAGPAGFSSTRESLRGLVYGAGVEMLLTPQISARVEALRYNFDGTTHHTAAGALDLGADVTTVRAGINWRFN